jgi:integrase
MGDRSVASSARAGASKKESDRPRALVGRHRTNTACGRAQAGAASTTVTDYSGEQLVVYDFKLHELRHTAASLAIQAGANIKALQNMLAHESAGLTLDRYGHLYGSDVEAVGVAINKLLTRECGQNMGTDRDSARRCG